MSAQWHRQNKSTGYLCKFVCARRGLVNRARFTLVYSVISAGLSSATAQPRTPDPEAWRPLSYADLTIRSLFTQTYADIWKDQIDPNNLAGRPGDRRQAEANAPIAEAHFVIWSPQKSIVVSILDAGTGCDAQERYLRAGVTVKLCPMRVTFYEGVLVQTTDAGRGCFLEFSSRSASPTPDQQNAASYAAYDVASKTVKLGVIVDHKAIDGCSRTIPLYPP